LALGIETNGGKLFYLFDPFMDDAEDQIGDQHHPNLRFDALWAVREKVAQLEVLFDFLEKRHNFPAVLVKQYNSLGLKLKQIGHKAE